MKFFSTIFYSCYGFSSYTELLNIPYRQTLRYLAVLIALLLSLVVINALPGAIQRIDAVSDFVDREFPKFEIRNGIAVATDPAHIRPRSRVALDLSEPGTPPAGGDAALPPKALTADVVVQRDRFLVREESLVAFMEWLPGTGMFEWPEQRKALAAPEEMFSIPFSKFAIKDGAFTGESLRAMLLGYLWNIPMLFVLMVIIVFLLCLAQAHIFSTFAAMFERQMPSGLTFQQIRNLATYAITPAAIIVTVYRLFHLDGMPLHLIYLTTYSIFLLGSANACRPRKEQEALADDSELF